MPSRMVINTESIVGYDNFLVITDDTMKLGVNNNINRESHKPSLKQHGWRAKHRSIRRTATHQTQSTKRQQKPKVLLLKRNQYKHQPQVLQPHKQKQQRHQQPNTDTNTSHRYNNNKGRPRRYASCKQGTCRFWCARFCRLCFLGEQVVIIILASFLVIFSIKNAATKRISSQAFLAKKCDSFYRPARNTRLAIAPTRALLAAPERAAFPQAGLSPVQAGFCSSWYLLYTFSRARSRTEVLFIYIICNPLVLCSSFSTSSIS